MVSIEQRPGAIRVPRCDPHGTPLVIQATNNASAEEPSGTKDGDYRCDHSTPDLVKDGWETPCNACSACARALLVTARPPSETMPTRRLSRFITSNRRIWIEAIFLDTWSRSSSSKQSPT